MDVCCVLRGSETPGSLWRETLQRGKMLSWRLQSVQRDLGHTLVPVWQIRAFLPEHVHTVEMQNSTICVKNCQRGFSCHVGAHGGLLVSGLSNDNYMWKALSPGHFCWQSFPNQKAHTDFLEDIYAWSGMNFIWTRDMFMCTKRRITQDLLAASQSKPELSGERQLVFKDTVAWFVPNSEANFQKSTETDLITLDS